MLYHTPPELITKIKKDGLFDDGLFFAYSPYEMGRVKATYSLDESLIKIANVWQLDEAEETIKEFAVIFDLDEDVATNILMEKDFVANYTNDYEDEWITQQYQLKAAKEIGCDAVELQDEQGASVLVSMSDKLHLLKLVQ